MMDEGLVPIWGPDGESILSFALKTRMLLPTGRHIRKPKVVVTAEPNANAKKPAMIALEIKPEVASQYGLGPSAAGQVNELVPDSERHITLAYLGEIDEMERKRAHDFTRRWLATGDWSTLQGRPQGFGTFIPPDKKDDTVLWMSWDIPGLTEMRTDLVEALKADGFNVAEDHGFVPHETIAYLDGPPKELPPFPTDIPEQNFNAVVVAEGDDWTEYPFPMAMALRGEVHTSLVTLLASADGSWEDIVGGEALVSAGGLDRNRGNAEALRRYWTVGPGGAKIKWNTPGDWKRCTAHLSKYLGPRAKGYCFSGDTEFLTRDGVMTFAEAVGTRQFVLTQRSPEGCGYKNVRTDNGYWVEAPIISFGEQRVLTVTLRRNGVRKVIRATPEHRWFTVKGRSSSSAFRVVQTDALQKGMTLPSLRPESRVAEMVPANPGIAAGIVFGDGSYGHHGPTGGRVDLHGEKADDLLRYFDGAKTYRQKDLPSGLPVIRVTGLPLVWRSLPSLEESDEYLYGWLAGYLAADGTVGPDGSIGLTSGTQGHLEFVQILAMRLGLPVRGIRTYRVSTPYREEPFDRYVLPFGKIGFPSQMLLREKHRSALVASAGSYERSRWVVESVEDHGDVEEVFCAVVPETETFTLTDNILVSNCQLRHKEMTRTYTGDMKHRIMYGWGGKPGSYWADKAANASGNSDVLVPVAAAGEAMNPQDEANPLVMLLGGKPVEPVKFNIPLLLPEGIESGDGRTFRPGSVGIRELPIPLLWQPHSMQGHDGSAIVGRIDSIERIKEGLGNARGVFDTSPMAQEAVRMIREGFLRGVSADLDQFEAKVKGKGPGVGVAKEKAGPKEGDPKDGETISPDKLDILKGRIMAATLVAKPAFEEVKIEVEDPAPPPDGEYVQEPSAEEQEIAAEFAKLLTEQAMATFAITAAAGYKAAPIYPPSAWFTDPELTKPTHLTITDDGRVFGHIAAWHVDHIGMGFGVRPPHSFSNYAYFRTGLLRTEEGTDLRVGQLTLVGGHASLSSDVRQTVKHYDDTASAFADVVAGEDRHGIWVAGSLRPTVTAEQVRVARASSPSGDWRPINGKLELVAVCSVNVPGFPVVEARVASGQVLALVAAGIAPLVGERMGEHDELQAMVASLKSRVEEPLHQQAMVASATMARLRMKAPRAKSAERGQFAADRALALEILGEAEFRNYDAAAREKMERIKEAMPGGRFPIKDETDLKAAISSYGRGNPEDRPAIRRHIMKRARALGKSDLIPERWKSLAVEEIVASAEFVDEPYPVASTVDLNRYVAAYHHLPMEKRAAAGDKLLEYAVNLRRPDLLPAAWDEEYSYLTGVPASLVAAVRNVRRDDWNEEKVLRDDIGRFRKIYYRLRNSPDAAKPEVRAAIKAIEDAGRKAVTTGATNADQVREVHKSLKKAGASGDIDERTQIEVLKAAEDMADMVHRFEIRGPETQIDFSQLPNEIQDAIERYLAQPGLEERITKHFMPFADGKTPRSVKDIINLIDRVLVDAHDYRKNRGQGMVSPERN